MPVPLAAIGQRVVLRRERGRQEQRQHTHTGQ
jgi:hypothetical protein